MKFRFSIVPCTISPVIRDMHRRTIAIEARDLKHARRIVKQAFPDGADLSGEWFVEQGTLQEVA